MVYPIQGVSIWKWAFFNPRKRYIHVGKTKSISIKQIFRNIVNKCILRKGRNAFFPSLKVKHSVYSLAFTLKWLLFGLWSK